MTGTFRPDAGELQEAAVEECGVAHMFRAASTSS
jgi:hypothetical protein